MNIPELCQRIEDEFECDDGPPKAWIDETRVYVTVTSDGALEGEDPDVFFLTEEAACRHFETRIRAYLAGKTRIFWRKRPEVRINTRVWMENPECNDGGNPTMECRKTYRVRARLYAE